MSLIDVFVAAKTTNNIEHVRKQLCALSGWKKADIEYLQANANFSSTDAISDFYRPKTLVKYQKAIALASSLGIDLPRLFTWSTPSPPGSEDLAKQFAASREIQSLARSRIDRAAWSDALRPTNDAFRESQRKALINYLLAQQAFVSENNIHDANSLFEYFLIDVQTTPLVQTTRMKQAISTVQLFVQRCLLGLEKDVPLETLDRSRWKWMQRYRTWEANRKIFLYPENWIDPSLRDNKTEFFKELEPALLQKDLTLDTVRDALRSYLYSVSTVSRLQCISLFVDKAGNDRIHVFARTHEAPYSFFYNHYLPQKGNGVWSGWETMHIDIPTYTIGDSGFVGNYLTPTVYHGRLLVFIGQLTKSTVPTRPSGSFTNVAGGDIGNSTPVAGWKIQLGWSEHRDGKWTPKQICPDAFTDAPLHDTLWDDVKLKWKSGMEKALATAKASLNKAERDYAEALASKSDKIADTKQERTMWQVRVNAIAQETKRLSATLEAMIPDRSPPIDGYGFRPVVIQQHDWRRPPIANNGIRIYLTQSFDNQTTLLAGAWLFNGSQLTREVDPYSTFPTSLDPGAIYTFGNIQFDHASGAAIVMSQQSKEVHVLVDDKDKWSLQADSSLDVSVDDTNRYLPNLSLRPVGVGPQIRLGTVWEGNHENFISQPFSYDQMHQLIVASNGPETSGILETLAKLTNSSPEKMSQSFGGVGDVPEQTVSFNECQTLYSQYNWELGLHAPMMLIDRLFKAQQFESALTVCHYVFNPLKSGSAGDIGRFWEFPPFKKIKPDTIESYFLQLKAANPDAIITQWREKPFQPHVVARSRPSAYMKWIVMKYIRILIGQGDVLFRQNTMESVQMAIQHYVLASHLYGPRGRKVPRRTITKRYTYNHLVSKFDAFSNAIVQFEEAFPYYSPPSSSSTSKDVVASNIFGSIGSLFFAIPNNAELQLLADTIDDRLFKIRNSQDITGVFRQLPPFEPPIDPGLLAQATAQGVSVTGVLNQVNGPVSSQRFQYLIQKALEWANDTKALGQTLLSVLERKDIEGFQVLRARQDISMQKSMIEIKQLALDEASKTIEVLEYSRKGAVSRLKYHLTLAGGETSGVPTLDQDFVELDAKLEKPVARGGLALSPFEAEEFDKLESARSISVAVQVLENAASVLHSLPNITVAAEPFGCGIQVHGGPLNLAMVSSAVARGLSCYAEKINFEASMAGRKGQAQRVMQDHVLQTNIAGFEVTGIDKQITAAKIRAAMAQKELEMQKQVIDHTQEVYDFLKEKYSSVELYDWMAGAIKTLHSSTYTQALEIATQAQRAYNFERPTSPKTLIEPGNWDSSHDGLLAAEKLYQALRRLEMAYASERGYEFEISKTVSLRRLDPLALIYLRETGKCEFTLPEILFDMDFPGHYLRRIKSVAITMPCLIGPYTNINATLRLQSSSFRINTSLSPHYVQSLDGASGSDARFTSAFVPITAIAVSTAQNDTGMVELGFRSETYGPFEGAGAISTWQLELPPFGKFSQFDYESITDVVMQVRYTSLDGGVQMKTQAIDAVNAYFRTNHDLSLRSGLVAVFDVKNEFGTAWNLAETAQARTSSFSLTMPNLQDRLPLFARRQQRHDISVAAIWVLTDVEFPEKTLKIAAGDKDHEHELKFQPSDLAGLQLYHTEGEISAALGDWTMSVNSDKVKVKKCWMLVKYKLAT